MEQIRLKFFVMAFIAFGILPAISVGPNISFAWTALNESTGTFNLGDQPSGTLPSQNMQGSSGFSETFSNPSNSSATTSTGGGGGGSSSSAGTKVDATVSYDGAIKAQQDAKQVEAIIKQDAVLQQAIRDAFGISELTAEKIAEIAAASAEIAKSISSSRSISIASGKTALSLSFAYSGSGKAANFVVYDTVPKSFAESSDNITVVAGGAIVKIVKRDPVYSFTYPTISAGESKTVTYSVTKTLDKSVLDAISAPIFFAEKISGAPPSPPAQPPKSSNPAAPPKQEQEQPSEAQGTGNLSTDIILLVIVAIAVALLYFLKIKPAVRGRSNSGDAVSD